LDIPFSETGSVYFDGNGKTQANGVTVIAGTTILHPKYNCTYIDDPVMRLANITCTRVDESGISNNLEFVVSYGETAKHLGILALPSPNAPPQFQKIQVSGSGSK